MWLMRVAESWHPRIISWGECFSWYPWVVCFAGWTHLVPWGPNPNWSSVSTCFSFFHVFDVSISLGVVLDALRATTSFPWDSFVAGWASKQKEWASKSMQVAWQQWVSSWRRQAALNMVLSEWETFSNGQTYQVFEGKGEGETWYCNILLMYLAWVMIQPHGWPHRLRLH